MSTSIVDDARDASKLAPPNFCKLVVPIGQLCQNAIQGHASSLSTQFTHSCKASFLGIKFRFHHQFIVDIYARNWDSI